MVNWGKVNEKYKIEVKEDGIQYKGKFFPKHIVNAVERLTLREFPEVTEDNVDVLVAFQLTILEKIIL